MQVEQLAALEAQEAAEEALVQSLTDGHPDLVTAARNLKETRRKLREVKGLQPWGWDSKPGAAQFDAAAHLVPLRRKRQVVAPEQYSPGRQERRAARRRQRLLEVRDETGHSLLTCFSDTTIMNNAAASKLPLASVILSNSPISGSARRELPGGLLAYK